MSISMCTGCLRSSLRSSTGHVPIRLSPTPRYLHASARQLAYALKPSASKKKKKGVENPEAMAIGDAIFLLKSIEVARPNNAIELHVQLDFKRGEAALRGRVALPRDARLKEEKILAFASGEQADQAREAGATWVGGEELVQDVLDGKIQPTKVVCTPGVLPSIGKLARMLGPRGLFPTVKRGTVLHDIAKGVQEAKGSLAWKGDKFGTVRAAVGRVHFPPEDIEKNVKAFLANVKVGGETERQTSYEKTRTYRVNKVHMSSTQGPGVELKDLDEP